jgi:hypothetical protein
MFLRRQANTSAYFELSLIEVRTEISNYNNRLNTLDIT